MNIDIPLDTIVKEEMLDSIDSINDMLVANVEYHFNGMSPFAPMYSYEYKEELKKLTKMKKHLIKVHNWYSTDKYKE